jgi:cytochrome c oxidase cbb3-type subunit III
MSDFTSVFWDYYVAIIVLVSVIGCGVFLKSQSKYKAKLDKDGNVDTTHHVWDEDLQEFEQPMPRWWVSLFYITVFFGLGYLVFFPGLGTQFKGIGGWTSKGQFKAEVDSANAKFGPMFDAFLKRDLVEVAADPKAHQIGERIFLNTCAPCHQSDARGARGFPNLTDEEWIWGGAPDRIEETITNGREGLMPPMAEAVGSPDDQTDVANYVLSLSNSKHDSARAARGQAKFSTICAACHGPEGKGNQQIGAPDISNQIWTYGGGLANIMDAIQHGHHGVMPAHKDVLSPAQIHLVAAYVYSLSHPGSPAQSQTAAH